MISLVANSGWYSASSSTVTIPVPGGVQSGDLLVGVVVSASAPPPDGSPYSFYGSAGYSLQASGDSLWLLTRFVSGSDPGIELPPYDLDEWNNQANTAAGIIFVFRGVSADFGISAVPVNYDLGPSVNSIFPTETGGNTYSITVSAGNELGSKSVSSNPYNLGELFDYSSSFPFPIRAIIYGGNVSTGNGSNSYVTLNISGSFDWWNTGGLAYKNYDNVSLSASISQSSNTFSGSATVVWPARYLQFGHIFSLKFQDNNTISATAEAPIVVRYLSLDKVQSTNTISSNSTAAFPERYVSSYLYQSANTIQGNVGFYALLDSTMEQENNSISSDVSCLVSSQFNGQQGEDVISSTASAIASLSMSATQESNAINAVFNGKLLFANIECEGGSLDSLVGVEMRVSVNNGQADGNQIDATIRHFWYPPEEHSSAWSKGSGGDSLWVKKSTTEVF